MNSQSVIERSVKMMDDKDNEIGALKEKNNRKSPLNKLNPLRKNN